MTMSDGTLTPSPTGTTFPSGNTVLFALAASVVLLDVVWAGSQHFDIDARNYALLAVLVTPLIGGAWFYQNVRRDAPMSAMLGGAAFLLVFSASCSLLSYLLSTVAGARIDSQLAAIDQAVGFHWPQLMMWAAAHKKITALLGFAYLSVIPQTAALLLILGGLRRTSEIYGLCLAIALGGLIAVFTWAIHPSFGAFSVFDLPPWAARNLGLALDGNYGRDLVHLLKYGPGRISPAEMRGIVGFPSYHTVQALVLIWYARRVAFIRWVALVLNIVVLIATPIHGGHHLVDLAGGVAVTIVAIALADAIAGRVSPGASSADVRALAAGAV